VGGTLDSGFSGVAKGAAGFDDGAWPEAGTASSRASAARTGVAIATGFIMGNSFRYLMGDKPQFRHSGQPKRDPESRAT
jgi:hypothetical protein